MHDKASSIYAVICVLDASECECLLGAAEQAYGLATSRGAAYGEATRAVRRASSARAGARWWRKWRPRRGRHWSSGMGMRLQAARCLRRGIEVKDVMQV